MVGKEKASMFEVISAICTCSLVGAGFLASCILCEWLEVNDSNIFEEEGFVNENEV